MGYNYIAREPLTCFLIASRMVAFLDLGTLKDLEWKMISDAVERNACAQIVYIFKYVK